MIKNVNHISFTVSDLDVSLEFYNKVLGLKILDVSERKSEFAAKATGIRGAHLKIAYLSANNCSIELIQYLAPKGKKIDTTTCNVGSAHICFNIDNFLKFVEKVKKAGGKFKSDPLIIPAGPNKNKMMVYASDPDSNNLEFISTEKYV